ncbi:MAG: urease accessory protein UreD [Acidobacteriaceae bacterium]|nr:urease accessory protein UreD [Acidobacteriaceae bacterium]
MHLNNVSGGIFGGDSLHLHGTLLPGAEVQLTTTGATRLYFPRAEASEAELRSTFHLGQGSLLEYLPDALIPFENARAMQQTTFHLDRGATLFAWDVVAPGRKASGEMFRYERLKLITEVQVEGKPVLCDRLLLEPRRWTVNSPGRLGTNAGYLVTFLAVQAGANSLALRELEASLMEMLARYSQPNSESLWGASVLPAHGLMVRGVVSSSLEISSVLHAVWAHCKQQLMGRPALPPRKIY